MKKLFRQDEKIAYYAGDDGKIFSLHKRTGRWFELKLRKTNRGYLQFGCWHKGKMKNISIHRAVWEAFNGPVPQGLEINHKNCVRDDNRLENLELATSSGNNLHPPTRRAFPRSEASQDEACSGCDNWKNLRVHHGSGSCHRAEPRSHFSLLQRSSAPNRRTHICPRHGGRMNEEKPQKLCATTKVNPFPIYLQLVSMDEKTARERGADGLASRAGQVITVEISLKLTRREAVPVLAHEISHVIEMVADIIEDDISGEIRAYLTGWMMEWMNSVFCAWRKR